MDTLDYKDTLNLPTTEFPMKANLAQREPEILARWQEMGIYNKMLEQRDPAHAFLLNDGPPYANGDIHIGHALNKILKDIVVKSKALSGFYAPFIPGWDCHGLPIEVNVEKKIGKAGVKVDAKTFRQHCREYAASQIDVQRTSFKRLGVFGDWDRPYSTMDFKFEANIMRTLARIVENGYIVRGDRPVHWCVHCGSALAEAEVEYMDKTSDAIDVLFDVVDTDALLKKINFATAVHGSGSVAIVIWTTTPWTLPANQAVAVNSQIEYALAQHEGHRLLIAAALVSENYTILGRCAGRDLEGVLLQHPFLDRQVPVVFGDYVEITTGTGCVHIAPAHGSDDYIVGKKYNLAIDNPVDANGCFLPQTPLFAGQHVFKANVAIIQLLQENKHLLAHTKLTHSYPHCWRHKEPLIFRATPQWFVGMEVHDLRAAALTAITQVAWIPQWGEARITGMIAGRPDWCISRQRTWGTPLALVIHKETAQLHPNAAQLIYKVADLVDQHGVQAWFDLELKDLLPATEADQYQKVNDILDVWFDSGAVHHCVADQQPDMHSPVDLYLEGSDQHRGWFQSSLLSSVAMKQQAPYKQVLTHGFTVDAEGKKMSKSMGNVVAPEKVIQTLGADVLRLWVAATDYRNELRVSDEILKRTSDAYRRIRNTARFLLANLHGFAPAKDLVAAQDMLQLDRWIVVQTQELQKDILQAYVDYDFHIIYQRLHNFCSDELGSFYLDVIKDRQYTCNANSVARHSTQTAMYYISEALVRWIAPILSFTAEEIWQYLPGERAESVFLSDWFIDFPVWPSSGSTVSVMDDAYWRRILAARGAIYKILEAERNNGVIGSGLEAEVTLYAANELYTDLTQLQNELRFVLITSQASVLPLARAPDTAVATEIPGLSILVHKSNQPKCQRCWHRTADVDQNSQYAQICQRCVTNLSEPGEERAYA